MPRAIITNIMRSRGLARETKLFRGRPSSAVRGWLYLALVCVISAALATTGIGTAAGAPTRAVANVSITEAGFSPAVVVVVIGTTVQWKNNGKQLHSLDGQVRSPTGLRPDQTFQRNFTTPGQYLYFDGSHPISRGTVVVVVGSGSSGSSSPPPEHGPPITHLYTANLMVVVNENWTFYDDAGCDCTTPPCSSQSGSGSRVVHLDVLFPKVTYERYPSADIEGLYEDNVPGHFGKTTETTRSEIATLDTPLVACDGGEYHKTSQPADCDRNFTGKPVTLSLAWGPVGTKNTFLITNSGPEISPRNCQDVIGAALVLVGDGSVVLPLNLGDDEGVAYDSAQTDLATKSEVTAMRSGVAFTVTRSVDLNFTTPCCEGFNPGPGGSWANTGTIRSYAASLTLRFTPLG
jgi:plastocyanin